MARHNLLIASSAVIALAIGVLAPPARGTTVAYYRFEEGANGMGSTGPNVSAADNVVDSAGGDDPFRTFGPFNAPSYASVVPAPTVPLTGAANALSMQNGAGRDYFQSVTGPLRTATFTNFTVEAYVNLSVKDNGWQTIVGRDDNGDPGESTGPQSLFYLGVAANDAGGPITPGAFRVEVIDHAAGAPGGANLQVNSAFQPAVNTWYHVAAVGDAAAGMLSLFVNGVNVGSTLGYTQLFNPTVNTSWTIGRGQFFGDPVDNVRGYIDEVRFSNSPLTPIDFLGNFEDKLVLIVDKNSGAVAIRNVSSSPVTFNRYEIASADGDNAPGGTPGGALDSVGWFSLSDQNIDAGLAADLNNSGGAVDAADLTAWRNAVSPNTAAGDATGDGISDGSDFLVWQRQLGQTPGAGDSWAEAAGPDRTLIGELFVNNGTTLGPGAQVSLGPAFDETNFGVGVDGNLEFRYALKGEGALRSGAVQYVTSGPAVAVPEPASLSGALAAMIIVVGRSRKKRGMHHEAPGSSNSHSPSVPAVRLSAYLARYLGAATA